jgi:hypothetical protein
MSGYVLNPDAVGDPNQTPRVQLWTGQHREPTRHVYIPDPDPVAVLVESRRPCASCGMPKQNRVHQLPETTPEARDRDASILGEKEEDI